jgi:hypothetical protein
LLRHNPIERREHIDTESGSERENGRERGKIQNKRLIEKEMEEE